jgi:hypothetical protein
MTKYPQIRLKESFFIKRLMRKQLLKIMFVFADTYEKVATLTSKNALWMGSL